MYIAIGFIFSEKVYKKVYISKGLTLLFFILLNAALHTTYRRFIQTPPLPYPRGVTLFFIMLMCYHILRFDIYDLCYN